jgi:hypothetical protein
MKKKKIKILERKKIKYLKFILKLKKIKYLKFILKLKKIEKEKK